ncbi:MAG TPA: RDD family protein, partial [Thermodesulfobacteriota bacterium]|nr:RDD family protein [Thermodesulfobacteriota bacterium]
MTGPEPGFSREFTLGDEPDEAGVEPAIPANEAAPAMDRALRGGFWLRTMAMMADDIILLLLLAVFVVLGFVYMAMSGAGEKIPMVRQVRIVLPAILPLAVVLKLAYFTYFHGTWGQTVGKMLFGLRVVRSDGEPVGYSRALMRTIWYSVSTIPLFLGFFWAGFTSTKRSWHDMLSDT